MQLRAKLTLLYLALTAILMLIAFILIFYISKKGQSENFRDQLSRRASTSANLLLNVTEVDSTLLKIIDKNRKDIYSFENISIYSPEGHELYTNNDTLHFHSIIPDFKEFMNSLFSNKKNHITIGELEIVGGIHEYEGARFVYVASAVDSEGKLFLIALKRTLIFVYFSILCISGYIGWLYAGKSLKPIRKVMNELDKITATNLNDRLKLSNNNDEISRLIITFNELLERLNQSFNDQKSFISYASHELNNPLASIKTQIDVILLKDRSGQEYIEVLNSVKLDVQRLEDVSKQLLLLSRITSESEPIGIKNIRIDEFLLRIKNDLEAKFPNGKIYFSYNLPENMDDLNLKVNEILLNTVINNLLENGLKYSPNSEVRLTLAVLNGFNLQISNKTDLKKDEVQQIFKPFYRVSKKDHPRGSGIGLAIVQRICEVCNYKITSDLEKDELVITLSLH